MLMVSLFAVTALILVIGGTYGVMSYYVTRRMQPVQSMVLGSGGAGLLAVALAAISVPVFRATGVDPNDALRTE